ncbi:MAG: VCBS repeat-containing protein [Proteobacteria bacterium]|nr:VCBS repeat-containing protein [Pseudomonadota bacterium]
MSECFGLQWLRPALFAFSCTLLLAACGGGGEGGGVGNIAKALSAGSSDESMASAPAAAASAPAMGGDVPASLFDRPADKSFPEKIAGAGRAAIYRFYNGKTGAHFFTISEYERDQVRAKYPQFAFEGIGFYAQVGGNDGAQPVFRFYNVRTGTHFFTISEYERDQVQAKYPEVYTYEGVAWYAVTTSEAGSSPVYRFYNTKTGTHFYTLSAGERDSVIARYREYSYEGIAYYAWLSPEAPKLFATSYQNFKEVGLTPQNLPASVSGVGTIRAFANFSGSGRLDMFTASITYWPPTTPEAASPATFAFWTKEADGSFKRSTTLLPNAAGCVHPRKAVVADFNRDGRPDLFVACHGFDAPPFPGERNKVVLSQPDGTYATRDAGPDVSFFHSASAADVNGDGFIDVVVVSNMDPTPIITLINQGDGTFRREAGNRFPGSLSYKNYFTIELVDVDQNGTVDAVIGGHEWEGATTYVLLNPGNFVFSSVTPMTVPAVANEGVVLDFTMTGSGASRSLWVVRTSGGDGTFYQSRTVQRVQWPSMASTVPLSQRPAQWFAWGIPTRVNGVNVLASEDASMSVAIPTD